MSPSQYLSPPKGPQCFQILILHFQGCTHVHMHRRTYEHTHRHAPALCIHAAVQSGELLCLPSPPSISVTRWLGNWSASWCPLRGPFPFCCQATMSSGGETWGCTSSAHEGLWPLGLTLMVTSCSGIRNVGVTGPGWHSGWQFPSGQESGGRNSARLQRRGPAFHGALGLSSEAN